MKFLEFFESIEKNHNIVNKIIESKTSNINLTNVATNYAKLLTASLFKNTKKTMIVVYPNIFYANKAYEDYLELLEADDVSFFPVEELIASNLAASSNAFRLARMQTIYRIINNIPQVIITNLEGFTRMTMSKERLLGAILNYKVKDIYKIKDITEALVERGYKKASITDNEGYFSVRGSVIDVFPVNKDNPIRINFFDDEIDSIKEIDIETQLSKDKLSDVTIFPLYDMYYEAKDIENIKEEILKNNLLNDTIKTDIESLRSYSNLDQLYIYLPYIDKNYLPFVDLISDKYYIFNEYDNIIEKEKENIFEISSYLENLNFKPKIGFFASVNEIINNDIKTLYITQFMGKFEGLEKSNELIINISTNNIVNYNNNIQTLLNDVTNNQDEKRKFIITHYDLDKLTNLKSYFDTSEKNIETRIIDNYQNAKNNGINFLVMSDAYGYIDYEIKLEIITPNEYLGGRTIKKRKYQQLYAKSTQIYAKEELQIGDYVVHPDYGIGKYLGIKTIEMHGFKNDYIQIEYAEDSKLYIPVENIAVLEKYLGSNDRVPKLTKAGSKEWQKKKERVKEKVIQIAKKLIEVQAKRELIKGYIYPKDTREQYEFEHDFPYNETKGQLNAINDVKGDLESEKTLDRLICGDVGFGKTEVAMRACFKVVDSGKQVAYLAPTTVLARQHYYSFKERFEKYGIRVELMSRFVDSNTQKTVINGLKNGFVDIVIGTHRLLSNDIHFKDLGLLIIDEEHRFGVEHKEKIKQLKANVDVLSLTATPIPRTLQMALTGLRDLSLIDTPPTNRLAVQTYVLERNESVIRGAIYRELGRGGQVFYLMNRISHLPGIKRTLQRIVPEAKVAIIHGGMDKTELEDTLNAFIDNEYNVLVCTTIIETGIDIPNANTLIIERADILGLAQLYQIRGRVGRSDRIAYAYLMYEKDSILTETGRKRLETIKEYTELGSGYKIAMRDLSIRGAGDILGSEQSGFINDIGIDLYLKMLNEAIDSEKGNIVNKEIDRKMDISVSKHVDEKYTSDDAIRIAMHESISKIRTRSEINNLLNEFTDRFGRVNDELKIYLESKYLEHLLKLNGVESYRSYPTYVELNFDQEKTKTISYPILLKVGKSLASEWRFEYRNSRIYIKIPLTNKNNLLNDNHYVYKLTCFLEKIFKNV